MFAITGLGAAVITNPGTVLGNVSWKGKATVPLGGIAAVAKTKFALFASRGKGLINPASEVLPAKKRPAPGIWLKPIVEGRLKETRPGLESTLPLFPTTR